MAVWKIGVDVLVRTLSLLMLGVFMVNDAFDSKSMGWPDSLWSTLMFVFAILAFCTYSHGGKGWSRSAILFFCLRVVGFLGLIVLALLFRGEHGRRLITFYPVSIQIGWSGIWFSSSPVSIHTAWWGILGLIGWAYLIAAGVYLLFRENRTGLLGCAILLMCLYAASMGGKFNHWWINKHVAIGSMLGSQASIAVFGVLLASILLTADTSGIWPRVRFTLLMVVGLCIGAVLLKFNKQEWGINKVKATPSWCLWSCDYGWGVAGVLFFV